MAARDLLLRHAGAMRVLLLVLIACSRPPPALPPAQPHRGDPLELASEYVPARDVEPQLAAGGQVKQLAAASTGHFAFTNDARWLAYLAAGGIHVVRTHGFAEHVIRSSARWFVPTPDSRWILHGTQIQRTSIDGGSPTRLAPDLEIHAGGHLVVSPDSKWVAFLASTGDLAIAPIDGGPARRLQITPPKDTRCHNGAGAVKAFSADSRWLVYQHGCETYKTIRRDGTGDHVVEPAARGIEAVAGTHSIGVGTNRFVITPLAGGPGRTVAAPPLFGLSGPKIAPDQRSFAFIAADYSLHAVDVATARLDKVSPAGLRVSSFIEYTPDSRRVLYANLADSGHCEFRMFELATRRDVGLVRLSEGGQCFIKAAGNTRAVIHTWRQTDRGFARELLLVDLETTAIHSLVRDTDPGNYYVSPDGRLVAFSGGRPQWPLSIIALP
jgi:Tol biopolymer transport system component